MSSRSKALASCVAFICPLLWLAMIPSTAHAWGDVGHEVVGEIASHFLTPAARQKAFAMLAADASTLTAHDFDSETTWADRFRDSDRNSTQVHYLQTRQWHFVDIEVTAPNLDAACFQHPPVPPGTVASSGPASDCVVDKLVQFTAELASPATTAAERIVALKFILHFVGDVHQPLHASDDHDAGGNAKTIRATGFKTGTLHGFWDTQFVKALGPDAPTIAATLIGDITPTQVTQWSGGTPSTWALESFQVARTQIYGKLPPINADKSYHLSPTATKTAKATVAVQLSKAGVRLATLLNATLGPSAASP